MTSSASHSIPRFSWGTTRPSRTWKMTMQWFKQWCEKLNFLFEGGIYFSRPPATCGGERLREGLRLRSKEGMRSRLSEEIFCHSHHYNHHHHHHRHHHHHHRHNLPSSSSPLSINILLNTWPLLALSAVSPSNRRSPTAARPSRRRWLWWSSSCCFFLQ